MDGICVSNHGGRVLETDITAMEVLDGIKNNIKSKTKLIIDGGIRTGSDIFKCLSSGADYVAIGRPVIFGLAVNSNIGIEGFWNFIFKSLKQLCIFAASMILIKLELKTLLVGLNKKARRF